MKLDDLIYKDQFWVYRLERIKRIAENYGNVQHPKFSLFQRLFKLSVDEKLAYQLYLKVIKGH